LNLDNMSKILTIVTLLLFGLYNGYFNLWGLSNNMDLKTYYSKIWHVIGWFIRFLLVLITFLEWGFLFAWIAGIASWHLFDILINIVRGQGLFYSGTVSYFDKIEKITWAAKLVWIIGGIIILI